MFSATSHEPLRDTASTLPFAVSWIESLLLGSMGTTVAVLAVAGIGFAMLQGRLSPRAGIKVALGCFILFGAPMIAKGLAEIARSQGASTPASITMPATSSPTEMPSPPPSDPDPYAGASVPM